MSGDRSRTGRAVSPTLVLLTASTGCALTILDTNVAAIVLPTIARDFGASFAEVEWVISTYVLCFAALLLPAGAIADRYGRRIVFLAGIAAFAISSWFCGAAPSAKGLYIARAFQGASAAFLLAPALAIIGHAFHEEKERNHAWAIWGGIMGLTMVLSPILGGAIAFSLGWRWAFHINIPLCALLAFVCYRLVDESRDENARKLDPLGIVTFAAGMFGLTWGLINGQAHGWSSAVAATGFASGVIALGLFLIVENAQTRPMLDLGLFKNRRFVGGVWAMFAYAGCAQVMASMLPLYLQNGLGRTALAAGFSMLPFALAMLIFPNVGRSLSQRLDSRAILATGLLVVGTGSFVMAWGAQAANWPIVMSGMLLLGSGGGLLNGETQKAIMSVVPRQRAGMASGISTTSRFSGILLGFAVLSGILATAVRSDLLSADCGQDLCSPKFAEAVVAGDLPNALSLLDESLHAVAFDRASAAYSQGFSVALSTSGLVAVISALVVFGLMGRRQLSNSEQDDPDASDDPTGSR